MTATKRKKKQKYDNTEETTIERLEKEIRELKALNRSLLKRLKKVDREYYKALEETEKENEEEQAKEYSKGFTKMRCRECSKGELTLVIVAGRKFTRCDLCSYRSKAEKI